MSAPAPGIRDALGALVEAMRHGGAEPSALPDDGLDPGFIERTAPLLEFFYSSYFRVRMTGIENIPREGPVLLVANHSGGLPWDGAMLIHGVRREHASHRHIRPLVADFVFAAGWMRGVVSRLGGVRASTDNGLRLLARDEIVAVFPEGLRGLGKPFRERYRLKNFGRGGFVRLARKAGVPMIPAAIVGAEEVHPVLTKMTKLATPLGIPYIPITPTFPWLGPLGLLPVPTRWSIKIGPPVRVRPEGDDSEGTTTEIAERFRQTLDDMIAELLVARRSILFG